MLGLVHFILTKTLRYVYLFSKHLFGSLYVVGTVLGTCGIIDQKGKDSSWGLCSSQGDRQ